MKTATMGTWEITYNEPNDEIRLFINNNDIGASCFRLNKVNLEGFLEELNAFAQGNKTNPVMVETTQPLAYLSFDEEYEEASERMGHFDISDAEFSKYCNGPVQAMALTFECKQDARMVLNDILDYWATDHILLEG